MSRWVVFVISIPVLLSWRIPLFAMLLCLRNIFCSVSSSSFSSISCSNFSASSSSISCSSFSASPSSISCSNFGASFNVFLGQTPTDNNTLEYDFYRETCPRAEAIVRSTIAQIYSENNDISAALLRLLFHDCFIKGCDASIFLDDSDGNKSHIIERQAIPNRSLKGFDQIDIIKEELENECPGVVSCADVLVLATRETIIMANGPFYPVLTGRRDSTESHFREAISEIPSPDDNVTQILHLFSLRGFNEKETVSLLGGHNIGKISCDFIHSRLKDPNITSDFANEIRLQCREGNNNSNNSSRNDTSPAPTPTPTSARRLSEFSPGMRNYQGLSASFSSGTGFDSHYYQSLLRGRGLLIADQQLMAEERTARLVRAYALDDGTAFRRDFASVMVKMSNLGVLTGSQGEVRLTCSLPAMSSK